MRHIVSRQAEEMFIVMHPEIFATYIRRLIHGEISAQIYL